MKIDVYETMEDLGSILLGIVTDVDRKVFDESCVVATMQGFEINRYDVRSRPEELANMRSLPVIRINDTVVMEGKYPTILEFASFTCLDTALFAAIQVEDKLHHEAHSTRVGLCCGVGADVYLDPNEEEQDS